MMSSSQYSDPPAQGDGQEIKLPASPAPKPDGLRYIKRFLPAGVASALLSLIDQSNWETTLSRRTQQYGPRFDYHGRALVEMPTMPFPEWCIRLTQLLTSAGIFQKSPDQVIINEYLPGQGIRPHIDRPELFGKTIVSITLGGGAMMEFTSITDANLRFQQWLAPGSLLSLCDTARYDWRHEIKPRDFDNVDGEKINRSRRVSITFRNIVASSVRPSEP